MEHGTGKKRQAVSNILKTLSPGTSSKKKFKQALEVSEEKYKSAFEYTCTGMMVLEKDMTISLFNQRICEMTGYSHEEIEGKRSWPDLVADQDRERMQQFHLLRRQNEGTVPKEYEFQYKHKSGTLHDALLTVSMVPGTEQSLVSLYDITERKAMEKELIESRKRFQETAELLPSIICEINLAMQLTYVNKMGYELFGYPDDAVAKGVYLQEIMHPEDMERAKANLTKIMSGEKVRPEEYRMVHKDGSCRDYVITSSRIMRDGNVVGVRSSCMDISDRKTAERKLRESEARFRSIFAASPLGIAVCDAGGHLLDLNSSFKKMFGLPESVECINIRFSLFEDLPEIKRMKKPCFEDGGTVFESKHDFKFARNNSAFEVVSTTNRHLEWFITPLGPTDGSSTLCLAQVQDITERKRAEEAKFIEVKKRADKADRMVAGLRKEIYQASQFQDMVSRSPAMQEIFNLLPEIAQTPTTVLITGESGTGKELIARSIHTLGPRKSKPFIAINCGALPDNLMESELFGYKAGAFTDAKKDKPGKFALADGGTLFLDEIGDVSPSMQVKLLRVLQERVFEPLGSTASVAVNVRIIAATNRNLPEMVRNGTFREDLYYRIKVLNCALPSLRERKGDIPLLCDHFITLFNARYQKNIREVSHEALEILLAHNFPGNIRELENVLEHAFTFCKGPVIGPEHLPQEMLLVGAVPYQQKGILEGVSSLEELERVFIMNILSEYGGSRIKTAQRLGIHKTTLFRKMKTLGIADDVLNMNGDS